MTTYDERLWPPVWLWAVSSLFVLSLVLAFYTAVGPLAVVLGVGPMVLLVWGLTASAAPVRVHDGKLTAGTATIPVSLLGPVEVLDPARARAVRGPESDPAAYHLIRGWVSRGIRAAVDDPRDDTPYWFVASRHPEALAAAIDAARAPRSQR
jgi:hypothetical protein